MGVFRLESTLFLPVFINHFLSDIAFITENGLPASFAVCASGAAFLAGTVEALGTRAASGVFRDRLFDQYLSNFRIRFFRSLTT